MICVAYSILWLTLFWKSIQGHSLQRSTRQLVDFDKCAVPRLPTLVLRTATECLVHPYAVAIGLPYHDFQAQLPEDARPKVKNVLW